MKIKLDIDCTPQEARQFFGLPDVTSVQEEMMQAMAERMRENLNRIDPEQFFKTWFPMTSRGFEEMRSFWMRSQSDRDSDD